MLSETRIKIERFLTGFTGVEKILLLLFILIIVGSSTVLIVAARRNSIEVPKTGGAYIEGLVGQPLRLNPLLAPANEVDADLSRIIYAGILKFDENLNLVSDLAQEMPEISKDGKEYTITLKNELYWQDGTRLTADDVVFTYQAIQNPNLQSPLRVSWNKVEVIKINDQQIKLVTRESSAPFLSNLTIGILPKHIWETVAPESFALSKYNLEPIGSGPFQVSEITRGRGGEIRSISFQVFTEYYAATPYLEAIIFKFYATTEELIDAYHSRDIMGLGYVPFDQSLFIEPNSKLKQFLVTLPQYQAVFINRSKNPAPLEDVRVRLALAKSVDKKKIISEVYSGNGSEAYGPILPGQLGYHEQIPGADLNIYDPEKAKSLLTEASWNVDPASGFRKDKLGRIITLNLVTNNFSPNVRVAEALKKMWEDIGIQIILNIETVADLEQNYIRPRNYELLLYAENVGADPDPFPFWHSSQLRDPGLNLSTFSNKTADKLLTEARTNIAPSDRADRYRKFQEIFVGDAPAIFIEQNVFVYNIPQNLRGLKINAAVTPAERFGNLNEWYIETKKVKK